MPKGTLTMPAVNWLSILSPRDLPELAEERAACDAADTASVEAARALERLQSHINDLRRSLVGPWGIEDGSGLMQLMSAQLPALAQAAQDAQRDLDASRARLRAAEGAAWTARSEERQAQMGPPLARMIEQHRAVLAVARLLAKEDIGHVLLRRHWQETLAYLETLQTALLADL